MHFRICHTTRFEYELPAYQSHNEVRMRPLDCAGQACVEFEIQVTPAATVFEYVDYYGNRVQSFSVHAAHDSLTVVARSIVERRADSAAAAAPTPFAIFLQSDAERGHAEYDFLNASRHVPFSEPMRRFFWRAKPDDAEDVTAYTTRIVRLVRDQFEYEPGRTRVHSTADEILNAGGGVCQDFAHLTIGVLRLAGVPARYVSGYLAPAPSGDAETIGAQASHAWLEAQLPGLGWTGFDPTHGCRVDERHLRVAVGRDYSDVPPMRGVYRSTGGRQLMTVELSVEPLAEHLGESMHRAGQQNQQ